MTRIAAALPAFFSQSSVFLSHPLDPASDEAEQPSA
jgi:hypothetical protein